MPSNYPKATYSSDNEAFKERFSSAEYGVTPFRIDWKHRAYKFLAFSVLSLHLLLVGWLFSAWSTAWSSAQHDLVSAGAADLGKYFHTFSGNTECGISLPDIYVPPQKDDKGSSPQGSFCPNREALLEAMTGGGRHGFDVPYSPKGCHYRWYSVEEICMILERFDSIVFIGDDTLKTIYSGLNVLIRRDLSLGALEPFSDLAPDEMQTCHCDNQFIKSTCSKHALTSSDQVPPTKDRNTNPYLCTRIPHAFLPISGSPLEPSTLKTLTKLIPPAPRSNYHPIPIITSLTPPGNPPSTQLATSTLRSLLSFTSTTSRKTPILWLGPTASGHLDTTSGPDNNALWTFSTEMERVAAELEVESLGLWNMTVQAESWDGRRFGARVALVQAMMVVNWLSRLESS